MGYPFALPELGYAFDALEPHIDARTMEIHHGKHHAGYTSKLNDALEGHTALHGKSAEELVADLGSLPESIRTAVRNNGGGYVNHALFWDIMRPGGAKAPSGDLAKAIDSTFGSFQAFKEKLQGAAGGQFGSGWGWLAVDGKGGLQVLSTPNQDSPLSQGQPDPRRRCLGARLLPALPEPAPGLSVGLVERRELGRGREKVRGRSRLTRRGRVPGPGVPRRGPGPPKNLVLR
jgi:superoxide dismutase, Fe-Mn family